MDFNEQNLKKCSFCNEDIPAGAGRCPYCGSLLEVVVDTDVFKAPEGAPAENKPAMPPSNNPSEAYKPEAAPGSVSNQGYSYNNPYGYREYRRPPLSNGLKVFLTVIFTLIPGIGQLAGIITAIVFMNTEDDPDRKSFGVAILVASLVMFAISCIGCFIIAVAASASKNFGY